MGQKFGPPALQPRVWRHDFTHQRPRQGQATGQKTGIGILIRNNQRRRRGGSNNGPRPQQMAGGNNYGPRLDNRQRGNATQLLEKYRALARDAQQAGDRVTAEYYLQYAEHYYRVLGDYRDRQPEGRADGRRGRDGFDDDAMDADNDSADNGDDDGDEADARDSRDARPADRRDRRDERPKETQSRDNQNRDNQNRDDRGRDDRSRDNQNRDDRGRDDGQREQRQRDSRLREERPRDERPREDRPREDRPREERPREWQRDRRDRRPERADRAERPADVEAADDRESLLQALPPPATMAPADPVASAPPARRLGMKRDVTPVAVAGEVQVELPVAEVAEAAPKRRGRPRKAAEPAAD